MHEKYMQLALELAEKARGKTSPNPLVGAVIVKDGQIIGQGYHQKAGGPHAEVFALNEAKEEAKGATMYVTLEPCSHYGRTPPCSLAIAKAGIEKVFVAMTDPNPLVSGQGIQYLKDQGIEVQTGILASKARQQNEIFLKYIQTRRPFVHLKWAMTLDGKIASETGDSRWISNEHSRAWVHKLRSELDAILIGINTVRQDDPLLTSRIPGGRNPIRIILDTHGNIPLDSRILNSTNQARTIIAVGQGVSQTKLKEINSLGGKTLQVATKNDNLDLSDLLNQLGKLEITSVLVEGGTKTITSFLKEDLADKVSVFISPRIIGGSRSPVANLELQNMDQALNLINITTERFNDDILITGYLKE